MRLELDASGLNDNTNFVDWFEVALALTSYGDQLALVIADGPEDQRFHVIHIDVGDLD